MENLSILDQIPCDWFQQRTNDSSVLEDLPHSDLLSSLTTLQNHIFICDTGNPLLFVNDFLLYRCNFRNFSLVIFVFH